MQLQRYLSYTGGDVTSISLVDGGQGYAQGDVVQIRR